MSPCITRSRLHLVVGQRGTNPIHRSFSGLNCPMTTPCVCGDEELSGSVSFQVTARRCRWTPDLHMSFCGCDRKCFPPPFPMAITGWDDLNLRILSQAKQRHPFEPAGPAELNSASPWKWLSGSYDMGNRKMPTFRPRVSVSVSFTEGLPAGLHASVSLRVSRIFNGGGIIRPSEKLPIFERGRSKNCCKSP